MAASDWEAGIVAIITGFTGMVAAGGGVLLIIRSVRNKERKTAHQEYEEISAELHNEREVRVRLEELVYTQRVLLAQNGIALPVMDLPKPEQLPDVDTDTPGPRSLPALGDRLHRRGGNAGDSGGGNVAGSG